VIRLTMCVCCEPVDARLLYMWLAWWNARSYIARGSPWTPHSN